MKPNKNVITISILQSLEEDIKTLLDDLSIWKSLDVDYYPPRVERLYTSYMGYRIHLHVIHSTSEKCLYHKHRWPAVFKQVKGSYTMGITYSESEIESDDAHNLPTLAKFVINEGSYYEMTQTNCLHFVQPDNGVSLSIMMTKDGEMYEEASIRKEILNKTLNNLSVDRAIEILTEFKQHLK